MLLGEQVSSEEDHISIIPHRFLIIFCLLISCRSLSITVSSAEIFNGKIFNFQFLGRLCLRTALDVKRLFYSFNLILLLYRLLYAGSLMSLLSALL